MIEFDIRLADEGDREHLFHVLSLWFPTTLEARYDWMYVGNPHGRALTWLAFDRASGEAVACTSVFPRKVMVSGRRRIGSIGGDCFVLPQYRRLGLATALHRKSAASMGQGGVDFMYGPPEPRNLAALLKAGSRVVGRFGTWVRPLHGKALAKAIFRGATRPAAERVATVGLRVADHLLLRRPKRNLHLEPASSFGPEFDGFFEEAAASHSNVCVRDSSYLTWRYLDAPSHRQQPLAARIDGRLVGFAALETAGDRSFLIDIFSSAEPTVIDALLQAVLDHASSKGATSLSVDITQGCAVAKRLRRLGFVRRETSDFQVMASPDDSQASELSRGVAWHFCTSDKDIDTLFREDRQGETRPSH